MICACGSAPSADRAQSGDAAPADTQTAPRVVELRLPEASGTVVYEDGGVTLDASNTALGYVMVRAEPHETRLKLRIACGEQTYTYDLPSGADFVAFPLQMGDGAYAVRVLENVEASLYAPIFEQNVDVALESEFAPYLLPSQYVDYDADSKAVAQSYVLAGADMSTGEIVKAAYKYVAKNIDYDNEKAATVQSGYLPDPDETLATGRGICFDYSALLATMLRAQGVPTQLVVGTVQPENILHAWNRVYVDGAWEWMDATLDGTGHREEDYTTERVY